MTKRINLPSRKKCETSSKARANLGFLPQKKKRSENEKKVAATDLETILNLGYLIKSEGIQERVV